MPRDQRPTLLPASFFDRSPLLCARELIGMELACGPCRGRILETEAYSAAGDPASHLFTRPSAREFASRHPVGSAYVFLNYGVHWLVNVLCFDHEAGHAGFVLFRSLEAVGGIAEMETRRGTRDPLRLCSGPGKLTAALGIDGTFHGRSLVEEAGFALLRPGAAAPPEVVVDRRIGISSGKDLEWRFLAKDHPGVSVKAGKAK